MNAYRNQSNRRFQQAAKSAIALVAFAVEDTVNGKSHWTRIGRMIPHSDGKGYVLLLSAMPVQNRIVVREDTPRPYNPQNGNGGYRNDGGES